MGSRLDLFSGFFLWSFRKEGNGGCRFFFFKWDDHLNGIINGYKWVFLGLFQPINLIKLIGVITPLQLVGLVGAHLVGILEAPS